MNVICRLTEAEPGIASRGIKEKNPSVLPGVADLTVKDYLRTWDKGVANLCLNLG